LRGSISSGVSKQRIVVSELLLGLVVSFNHLFDLVNDYNTYRSLIVIN
jgi:hypothetical protein